MAVTVVLTRHAGGGSTSSQDLYERATSIRVTPEGHLLVQAGSGPNTVIYGAYPPGQWVNAYLDDHRQWSKPA